MSRHTLANGLRQCWRSQPLVLNLITLVSCLAGGFAAAALVRYSPGFDSIPEDLEPGISPATLRGAARAARARKLAARLLSALSCGRGSRRFRRFAEPEAAGRGTASRRAPVTARLVALGTAGGCCSAACSPGWRSGRAAQRSKPRLFPSADCCSPSRRPCWRWRFSSTKRRSAWRSAWRCCRASSAPCARCSTTAMRSPALLAARARGVGPIVIASRYVLRRRRAAVDRACRRRAGAGVRLGHSDRSTMRCARPRRTRAAGRHFARHAAALRHWR